MILPSFTLSLSLSLYLFCYPQISSFQIWCIFTVRILFLNTKVFKLFLPSFLNSIQFNLSYSLYLFILSSTALIWSNYYCFSLNIRNIFSFNWENKLPNLSALIHPQISYFFPYDYFVWGKTHFASILQSFFPSFFLKKKQNSKANRRHINDGIGAT